jgi:hypothetical protein
MYAVNPMAWVQDMFEGKFIMTVQHSQYFEELGKLIGAKMRLSVEGGLIDDPEVISVIGRKMTDGDREYAGKIGLSVSSGQGVGKDAAAAVTAWFFLDVFPFPKVMLTAPSGNTLSDVIWAEMSKWRRLAHKINPKDPASKGYLEYMFELQSEKVFNKFHGDKGKEWFAVARTISANANPESQAETLAGRHEKFMLFIVDEATGVDDPVFKPLEGSLTGLVNIAILIYNPTRTKGFAIRSHFGGDCKRWIPIRWNAEESELVNKEHIKGLAEAYGKDSNPYRIRVLGLPPMAESDALIPPDWLADAVNRPIDPLPQDPLVKSLDCGAGGDKSVICTRKGGKVYLFKRNSTKDSNMLVGWIKSEMIDSEADALIGDSIGIGWHILGEVRRELGSFKIRSFDSRATAFKSDRFVNRRAEAYWNLRKAFENCAISIPPDAALIDQLSVIKFDQKEDSKGRIKIIKKSEIKKLMTESGSSPDEADALAMSYAFDDNVFRKAKDAQIKKPKARDFYFGNNNPTAWMGV